jgi:DNA polymerase alpha subunit A
MCGVETWQLSVFEGCCLKQGCNGRMKSVYMELALQMQLKYFDSLFDVAHVIKQQPQRRSGKSMAQELISIEKRSRRSP